MTEERDHETIPAPADDDLLGLLRELRGALEQTSALCVRVGGRLAQVEIAVLTGEHRMNVQRDELDALKFKVAELVLMFPDPQPTAAE
jgi:hypothetical protein